MLKKVSKKTLASLQLFRSCSVIFPEEAQDLDAALRACPVRVCVQRQAFKNVAQCVLTRATWNTDTGGSRLDGGWEVRWAGAAVGGAGGRGGGAESWGPVCSRCPSGQGTGRSSSSGRQGAVRTQRRRCMGGPRGPRTLRLQPDQDSSTWDAALTEAAKFRARLPLSLRPQASLGPPCAAISLPL